MPPEHPRFLWRHYYQAFLWLTVPLAIFYKSEGGRGGCHFHLQGLSPTKELSPCLLYWQVDYLLRHQVNWLKSADWLSDSDFFFFLILNKIFVYLIWNISAHIGQARLL